MNWLFLLCLTAGAALAVGQYFIYQIAPVEEVMGLSQKIFYYHLPLAWCALLSFLTVFVAGVGYLFKRKWFWDHLAGAAAEVGVLMGGLALITGSIWARHAWGVWWTWDPRLTTTLIMWYIYAGYLVLRSLSMSKERKALVSAVVGVVAFLDVPLVFYSAKIWGSYMHPPDIARSPGGLEPDMWTTLLVCFGGWALAWAALTALRFGQIKARFTIDGLATFDDA